MGTTYPRRLVTTAIVAAIPLALLGAGCQRQTAQTSASALPKIRHLASTIVLKVVLTRRGIPPCPPGFAQLHGPDADPAMCYRPIGPPIDIRYAAVSANKSVAPFGVNLELRPSDRRRLARISIRAEPHLLAVIVAGKAWEIAIVEQPLTSGFFGIGLATRSQVTKLLRLLGQPG